MTRTLPVILLALSALGCDRRYSLEPDFDPGDEPGGCPNDILGTFPEAGADDVFYRSALEVTFTWSEDGMVTLAGGSGDVAVTTEWVDTTLVITPSQPLEPLTTYELTVDYSCGTTTVAFATSELGMPTDPDALSGNTYQLDFTTARIAPAGLAEPLRELLPTLLGVTSGGATSVDLLTAWATADNEQDMCHVTSSGAADFSDNPWFYLETPGPAAFAGLPIGEVIVDGTFTPDAEGLVGVRITGRIDTRDFVGLLHPGEDDDTLCAITATYGDECQECGAPAGPYCLDIDIADVPASLAPGVTLEPVAEDEIDANAACS